MIERKEVKHIAGLARIGTTEEDIERFSHDLSGILEWIKQLEGVDVRDVEPMAHVVGIKNAFKYDEVKEFDDKEGVRKQFPQKKDNYNKVKSVL